MCRLYHVHMPVLLHSNSSTIKMVMHWVEHKTVSTGHLGSL